MTLLSAWALAGLVLIAPLVLAHMRRRRPPPREVASLLIWQELDGPRIGGERRLKLPHLPLLLLLQVLALALLVVSLARPAGAAPPAGAAGRVLVLDDSVWMSIPGRLAAGERELELKAAAAPRGTRIAVVVASAAPHILYRGGDTGLARALAAVRPGGGPEQLPTALSLAASQLAPGGRIVLARAPEDGLPATLAGGGELSDEVAGSPSGDQAILSQLARCGIGTADACEVLATIANSAPRAVTDRFLVNESGAPATTGTVRVPAAGQAQIALPAGAGSRITVRLLGGGALAGAAAASVTVPGADGVPPGTRVTLVGEPDDALVLARAIRAVAGVQLRLRTPSDYRPSEATRSDVVVIDGRLPGNTLPDAPGVLLVDPARVPGGRVGAVMEESEISGEDPASPALEGVDLSSLEVEAGGARALELPAGLGWVLWTPEGPLLAYGGHGGRRVAVLAFDPDRSDLPQLPAFPLLVANLLRQLAGSSPPALPGAPQASVELRPATQAVAGGARGSLAPWLLGAALLVILGEALYGARIRTRAALA